MFGFRADGTKVKDIDPIEKIIPYIMSTRNDACNLAHADIMCEQMDKWIAKQRENGINFNYMHILMAAGIRTFALKRDLNRFTIGGRIYQRHGLYISITLKESLNEGSPDITIKMRFTGQESVYQVKEKVDAELAKAFAESSKNNKTTNFAKILTFVPACLIKFGVGTIKLLDRWGLIPNSILNLSPFHTSIYLTNLKSIKGDAIYHHLYNFGTTGVFIAMGKEQLRPVVTLDDKIVPAKVMPIGITLDERFSDGFYFMKCLRLLKKFVSDPSTMEEPLDVEPFESPKERKRRLKKEAKELKKANKNKEKKNA